MGEIIASAEAAGMEKLDDRTKYEAFSLAVGKYIDDALKTGKMTEAEITQLGKEAEATPEGQKVAQYEAGEKPAIPVEAAGAVPRQGGLSDGTT